jgi:hypothetical protein
MPASGGSGSFTAGSRRQSALRLNLYAAELAPADTHQRDLVEAVLADFARLANEN